MQSNETTIYVVSRTYDFGRDETLAVFDDEKKAIDLIETVLIPDNLSLIDYENVDNTDFRHIDEDFFITAYELNSRRTRSLSSEGQYKMRLLKQRFDDAVIKAYDILLGKEDNDAE